MHEGEQDPEHLSRGWILFAMLNVLVFSALLCVAAQMLLGARMAALGPHLPTRSAGLSAAMPAPNPNVRRELFGGPGAGQQLKARQREQLRSYGWVDRQHGVIRIPIEVAIDLIGEQGR
jgi:hypothetical protein